MLKRGLDKGVVLDYTEYMKMNRRRLKVQRDRLFKSFTRYCLALIVFSLFIFAFARFEAWFNSDYYTARCAGYGYHADCKTPLK